MYREHLFRKGEGGYSGYRIPSVVATGGNRLLVFAEARRDGLADWGRIDIVCRGGSADGGFAPQKTIAGQEDTTISNPTPVMDADTGILWLMLNSGPASVHEAQVLERGPGRTALCMRSADLGETWSEIRDIGDSVRPGNWSWYAMGPCHAIQLRSGRLLVPANHAVWKKDGPGSGPYISHVLFSDDHGTSWRLGGEIGEYTNECSAAQLPDGRLYMNMRSFLKRGYRAVSVSSDEGITWTEPELDPQLPDPCCQASVICVGDTLYFSNAADSARRVRMTVRKSTDGGYTWSGGTVIHEGPSAYSDLACLPDGRIACVYEGGEEDPYEGIRLAVLDPEEIR